MSEYDCNELREITSTRQERGGTCVYESLSMHMHTQQAPRARTSHSPTALALSAHSFACSSGGKSTHRSR